MEAQYLGANCIRLSTKKAQIVIDDNLAELGLNPALKAGDIALYTGPHGEPKAEVKLIIDYPGEYEVSDVSIIGVAARSHLDEEGQQSATMYRLIIDDLRVVVTGHVFGDLSEEQLEALGTVDILFIPVGGNGYTLDGVEAIKLVKKIEPKLVIPTHYADKGIKYPVEQHDLETELKNMAMEPRETVAKLKVKAGELTDTTQLVVLERQ